MMPTRRTTHARPTLPARRTMFTRLSLARQWKCVEWLLLVLTAASMALASRGQGRAVPERGTGEGRSPMASGQTGPLPGSTFSALLHPGAGRAVKMIPAQPVRPLQAAMKTPPALELQAPVAYKLPMPRVHTHPATGAAAHVPPPGHAVNADRSMAGQPASYPVPVSHPVPDLSQFTGQSRPELVEPPVNYALNQPPARVAAVSSGPMQGSRQQVMVEASNASDVLHLPVGRSMVLSTGASLRRIYVGDPKILESFSSGPKEDVITARVCGVSTLILWDAESRRRMYTVYADYDTDGLSRAIADALPDANVSVTSKGNRIYLAGTVEDDAAADRLGKLAGMYSKDVVNGVRVLSLHAPQIELKLRIVEVDRNRLQQYGLNFFALGTTLGSTSTQQFSTSAAAGPPVTISDPLNLLLFNSKLNAGVTIKDLEQKQVLQVLAEPTLTTLSGVAARFLSGGEFPLPVVQGGTGNSTAITIVWKPYGVKVEFTPTANGDGTIRLKVAPEVSTLDYTNAVTISGFVIPALSTRRAETEVELQNGQSFVLSGLLDHRTADNLSRMPGIASVPILGQLFRSKGLTLSTIDLVVVVTATFVDPLAHPRQMAEPKMVLPNLDKPGFDRQINQGRPDSRPGQTPGQTLGQTPGQTLGQTLGQTNDSPDAAGLSGAAPQAGVNPERNAQVNP